MGVQWTSSPLSLFGSNERIGVGEVNPQSFTPLFIDLLKWKICQKPPNLEKKELIQKSVLLKKSTAGILVFVLIKN